MMAVVLPNIVVGYAGLLDLGYVAFYALGAYAGAWFASHHSRRVRQPERFIHFGAIGVRPSWYAHRGPGFSLIAGAIAAAARVADRTADVAAQRGLPRDRHARLRRDHPQVARNGDKVPSAVQPDRRPARDHPDRPGRLRELVPQDSACLELTSWPGRRDLPALTTGRRSRCVLFTVFCTFRLRDSRRGRAWIAIREDEPAAAAMGIPLMRTKSLGLRDGRILRRGDRSVLAFNTQSANPDSVLLQLLGFRARDGDPRRCRQRLGSAPSALPSSPTSTRPGLQTRGAWLNQHLHV